MENNTTENLLKKVIRNPERRIEYEGLLLERWRQGVDLRFLVDFLQSEKSHDRLLGAYYLGELGVAVEGLKVAALQLASDALSDCRRAFVGYMTTSGYYDEPIANALAKCLMDLDLYVRIAAIKWAAHASEEIFVDFARLVEAGAGGLNPKFPNPISNSFWSDSSLKRATRGLNIIRFLRSGDEIQKIRTEFSEEDSFVFDSIVFSETSRQRYRLWKRGKSKY